MQTKIEKINYFGNETGSDEWNAKVLYRTTNGKLHVAQVYVCFWSRTFYIAKNQPSECKVTPSLGRALSAEKAKYFKI